jgi:hypothetical protein
MIFNPLACNSLYKATTFGFSPLQGPHHEAQKSMMVTLPIDSFNEICFPSGFFAEKSGALPPTSTLAAGSFFIASNTFLMFLALFGHRQLLMTITLSVIMLTFMMAAVGCLLEQTTIIE